MLALPSHQESFALPAVEALAFAVPVLVSNHVNRSDEILAARPGSVATLERQALERPLIEAMRDKHERTIRGAAGKKLVTARYTWSAVGANQSIYTKR